LSLNGTLKHFWRDLKLELWHGNRGKVGKFISTTTKQQSRHQLFMFLGSTLQALISQLPFLPNPARFADPITIILCCCCCFQNTVCSGRCDYNS